MSIDTDLAEAIKADIKEVTHKVALGKCTDYTDYKRDCGYLAGLRKALELQREILTKVDENDNA